MQRVSNGLMYCISSPKEEGFGLRKASVPILMMTFVGSDATALWTVPFE